MYRRGILAVCAVVLMLAVFFQFNRMDVFTKLFASRNIVREMIQYAPLAEEFQAKRESFLIIYDPTNVYSTYGKVELEKYLAKVKRRTESCYFIEQADYSPYKAVIVAMEEFSAIPEAVLKNLSQYVENGGSVYLTGIMSPSGLLTQSGGIPDGSGLQEGYGVRLYNHAFIGVDGFASDSAVFISYFLSCSLADDAKLFVETPDGKPLLWERKHGRGKFVVFNNVNALKKDWRGFFAAGLSRLYDDFSYPVIGAKVVFIDDFPAPVPEGRLDSIYNEFKMNTEDFYRYVWWPDMLSISAGNNVKYTGLVIESYNDRIKPPFTPDAGENARKYLVSYGRELLKSGGEMGVHGYNHQSLAMEGYNQDELGYNVWESPEEMGQAVAAVRDYIQAVYPDYVLRSYVPPSNVLSPEGKEAIRRAIPSVNIFCSLYSGTYDERCFYQDFGRNPDNTYDIPRVSSGFDVTDDGYMTNFSVINAYGISTHFVHPDELYYKEKENQSWGLFRKSFGKFTKEINERYPWLRAATASEAANYIDVWYDFDYVTNYLENGDLEFLTNGVPGAYIIFRTTKEIDYVEGCLLRDLGYGAYLLQTEKADRLVIHFEEQQEQGKQKEEPEEQEQQVRQDQQERQKPEELEKQ